MRVAALTLALASCGSGSSLRGERVPAEHQRLSPLVSPCVFNSSTGAVTIILAAGEQAMLERRVSDSALLANGEVCLSAGGALPIAKSTTALSATITGAAGGGETLMLDFVNGVFLRGGATGPAVVVNLQGGGVDVVEVRTSSLRDVVKVGALGWDISGDGLRDFTLAGVSSARVTLGDGDDVFSAAGGGALGAASTLSLTVFGGNGDDTLTGGDGNDTLSGDLGADMLSGGASLSDSDVFAGGGGADTVTYAGRSGALTITVGAGADDGAATETDDLGADVEVVIGGSGADAFTGCAGAQTFYGGGGNDTFFMGLLASSGAGADTVYGEAGVDVVDYSARLEAITVTMDFNTANDGASGEGDNVRNDVEQLVCPSALVGCTVTGNAQDNRITGGGGVDLLDGAAGDDTFIVNAAGADRVVGGAGVDLIDFSAFGAALNVRMDDVASVTQAKRIALDVENLLCPVASACSVLGNSANNHVWGSSQVDTISTGGGDDFVETSGGADVVDCGDGSDILIGAGAAPVGSTCEL